MGTEMDDSKLDTLLRRSAPSTISESPMVEATVLALVEQAEVNSRPARRRRRALWVAAIPAAPILVLGLTAGIEERLAPDLTIPIAYTTDTGVPVRCSVFLFNGEINWVEVSFTAVDYLSDVRDVDADVGEQQVQHVVVDVRRPCHRPEHADALDRAGQQADEAQGDGGLPGVTLGGGDVDAASHVGSPVVGRR